MTNPLLDELDLQTVEVSLPTGGIFYEENVLEATNPEAITIYPLGIIAEQAYRDPLLLASGRGLPKMLKEVCPSIDKPEELAEVDSELILLATRMLSYGNDLLVDQPCSECGEENKIKIDLQNFIMKYDPLTLGLAEIDPDFGVPPQYIFPIKETGQTVVLRPMAYRDATRAIVDSYHIQQQYDEMSDDEQADNIDLLMSSEAMDKYSDIVNITGESGISSIVANIHFIRTKSGQDVYDLKLITDWLVHLNTNIVERLQDTSNELAEKLRNVSEVKYSCAKCEHDNVMFLQLDPQRLFSLAEGSETQQSTPSASSTRTVKKKKKTQKTLQR